MSSQYVLITKPAYKTSLLEDLSLEVIAKEDPFYIFIVQAGDDSEGTKRGIEKMFKDNPLWQNVDAVKNNRVHIMDKKLYNFKPNNKWGIAYDKLEGIL